MLERSELTAGSSWHAAGSLFGMTTPSNASVLQKYTQDLYPELEKESGQSCGFHRTGGLLLVRTPDAIRTGAAGCDRKPRPSPGFSFSRRRR